MLKAVLIANRIDSKDRQRLDDCRAFKGDATAVRLIETRVMRDVLEEKMQKSGVDDAMRPRVRRWFLASRLVFGEASISLWLVDPLVRILKMPEAQGQRHLVDLLLAKLPTISHITAE